MAHPWPPPTPGLTSTACIAQHPNTRFSVPTPQSDEQLLPLLLREGESAARLRLITGCGRGVRGSEVALECLLGVGGGRGWIEERGIGAKEEGSRGLRTRFGRGTARTEGIECCSLDFLCFILLLIHMELPKIHCDDI